MSERSAYPTSDGERYEPGRGLSFSYTADEIIAAIGRALDARDMEAVAAFMPVLAVKDPHAAQAILDALDALTPASPDAQGGER